MKLTTKEKWRLAFEAVITAGIIFLCYFAAYEIFRWFVVTFKETVSTLWLFGDVVEDIDQQELWGLTPLVFLFLDYYSWRCHTLAICKRRYRQYKLKHDY